MFNLSRQGLLCNVQRFNCRLLSSVVPEVKIDDFRVKNEPILSYLKGSKERKELVAALQETAATCEDVPIVIGDEEIRTSDVRYQVMPHSHQKKIAKFYYATSQNYVAVLDQHVS